MKTKLVCTNVGEGEEEEKKNSLMINPRSTSSRLSRLAPELVVMVASHLDVSSYLALASSSNVLLDILTSQVQWKALLQKTKISSRPRSTPIYIRPSAIFGKYVNIPGVSLEAINAIVEFENSKEVAAWTEVSDEVYELAGFLKNVHDPEDKLLLLLLGRQELLQ